MPHSIPPPSADSLLPPVPGTEALPPSPADEAHENDVLKRRKKFSWKQFGGDGFLVSVAFHVLLLLVALFFVIQKYTEKKKDGIEVFATGAGGGAKGDVAKIFEHKMQRKMTTPVKTPSRIVSKAASTVSLPNTPTTSTASFASGLSSGNISKGDGGGSGGGIGTGKGIGVGGGRNLTTLFGRVSRGGDGLEGTLYDLKTRPNRTARINGGDMNARVQEMHEAVNMLVRTKFKKTELDERYFKASNQLSATNFRIGPIQADLATSKDGFDCADIIRAPGWLAYYEGWFTAPDTDSYRFCGMGDDMLLVAVEDKPVLWSAWPQGGMPGWVKPHKDWDHQGGAATSSPGHGGRYFGTWIPMQRGTRYRIVVVLSECYGGLFSADIGIQKKKTNDEHTPAQSAPMALFQLSKPTPEELTALQSDARKRGTMQAIDVNPELVFGLEANGLKAPPKTVR